MSARAVLCPNKCGASGVWATAPNGGLMLLDPYPDDDTGRYFVVTRGGRLTVVQLGQPGETVHRYHAHRCAHRDAVPRVRPQQLPLPLNGES